MSDTYDLTKESKHKNDQDFLEFKKYEIISLNTSSYFERIIDALVPIIAMN